MRDKMITTLEAEIDRLNVSYALARSRAVNLLERYEGRQVSTHLGHNLANCATELSELAARVESTQSILAYVRQQTESNELVEAKEER